MITTKAYEFLRNLMLPIDVIENNTAKKGVVIDLGCGQGSIAKLLSRVKTRNVIGVDLNAKRLPDTKRKNLKFINGDITKYKVKNASTVIISDVLHHIDYKNQKRILTNVYKGLKKNGKFLIKEIDTSEFTRSRLSRFWDYVLYPKDKIYYNKAKDLKSYLKKLGFEVKIQRESRLFPGSTTLFLCSKK